MENFPRIAAQIPTILLPKPAINYHTWAVIACDQYTSEPWYWEMLNTAVGENPSTLRMILPEVYLGKPGEAERIALTRDFMRRYLDEDILTEHEGLILVERNCPHPHRTGETISRHGIMLALDLEQYDYKIGSQSLIRATEGTIIERLPPRIKIRKGAPLELPHILVLIDDPEQTVIEPLLRHRNILPKLYDFDLYQDSGHLVGYHVNDPALEKQCVAALEHLAQPETFYPKYGVEPDVHGVLLYAMGDGNHSLATAKAIWEEMKPSVGMEHPSRYALVEVVNIHDPGLMFEPIHRVLTNVNPGYKEEMSNFFPGGVSFEQQPDFEQMMNHVNHFHEKNRHCFGLITAGKCELVIINDPSSNLPVGSVQQFLDDWKQRHGYDEIDYIHGAEVVQQLGEGPSNLGIYLPAMDKYELFRTVILDGALPRKTFSMGEAREKRFYMECRKIN